MSAAGLTEVKAPTWLSQTTADSDDLVPVLRMAAPFSLDDFFGCLDNLVQHPEQNSSLLVRADILSDERATEDKGKGKAADDEEGKGGWAVTRRMRRKLIPRSVRDVPLLQDCIFKQDVAGEAGEVQLVPLLDPGLVDEAAQEASLPFYHPRVKALAFRYHRPPPQDDDAHNEEVQSVLDVCIRPFASTRLPLPLDGRLSRTLLALLSVLHKHCLSQASSQPYSKRVFHDVLVPKRAYQDLYLELKQRYLWLVGEWKEKTDPAKHVFEDVGIATWLICLWRDMYPERPGRQGREAWGRPPGGFVDVGCGNGLLVYILHNEGYEGFGFDLRSRKSWTVFQPLGAPLHEIGFLPSSLLSSSSSSSSASMFPEGCFLIGNHADELTPWIPIITARTPGAASASIPCCMHKLVGRFTNTHFKPPCSPSEAFGVREGPGEEQRAAEVEELVSKCGLESIAGPDELRGRYKAYCRYLAHLTLSCGLIPEHEALRIPSTKNIAIVARNRCADSPLLRGTEREVARQRAAAKVIRMIEDADRWAPRAREGKVH